MTKNIIAVVGASDNREKYNIIYRDLRSSITSISVNPKVEIVEGDKCYYTLSEIPFKVNVVNTVVPPFVTEQIVKECKELGIDKVWMQPGSESENAITFCKENGIDVIYENCIMTKRRLLEIKQGKKTI